MSFRAGAHHRTKLNKWVQDLKVRQIYRHPKYDDPVMFAIDVALLLLDRPAQINSAVRPICLPGKNDRPRTDCTVTGWGRLGDFGRRPDYLMQVNTPFKDEHVLLLIRIKSSKIKADFRMQYIFTVQASGKQTTVHFKHNYKNVEKKFCKTHSRKL